MGVEKERNDKLFAAAVKFGAAVEFVVPPTGLPGHSDPILLNAGSAAGPTYSFTGDPDTGAFNAGADVYAFGAGGVEASRFSEVGGSIIQRNSSDVGLTADAGSSQGDGVILSSYNVYTTVAMAGDAATLPAVFGVGTRIFVKNDGAESMDVFPASGDDAGAGADTAIAIDAGSSAVFIGTAADATWSQLIVGGGGDVIKVGTPVDNQIGVWTGDGTLEGDANFTWDGDQLLLPQSSDAITPTLAFGDGNSGIFEFADNQLAFAINSGLTYLFNASTWGAVQSTGAVMLAVGVSAVNPSVRPRQVDADSGMGSRALDQPSIIAGGIEALTFAELNGGVLQVPNADLLITAFATGGQANAVQLNKSYNRLSVVVTTGDSVKLPVQFLINSIIYVKNDGANAADLFPAVGDNLGAGIDTAISIPAGEGRSFIAVVANNVWTQLIVSAGVPDPLLLSAGSLAAPSYSFLVDPDTGIFRTSADQLRLAAGGVEAMRLTEVAAVITVAIAGDTTVTGKVAVNQAAGPAMLNETASGVNPTLIPDQSDPDTGIGRIVTDQLSLIAGGVEIARVKEAGATARQFIIAPGIVQDAAANPSLAFGDGDSGFFESVDDRLVVSTVGLARFAWSGNVFGANQGAGPAMLNEDASSTNPTLVPNQADDDTGIGRDTVDGLAFIAGGVSCMRVREIAAAPAIGLYTTTPIVKQTGVAVTAAGIHAALVNLGAFSA